MSEDFERYKTLGALAPVLDEHVEWFGLVVRRLAYPEYPESADNILEPDSFKFWHENRNNISEVAPETLEQLKKLHRDMIHAGQELLETADSGTKPSFEKFNEFKNLYDDFLHRIRRIEKDSALENCGIDQRTGLRSHSVLERDLKVEMERVARRGNPLSLILARIDDYAKIKESDENAREEALKLAAQNIRKCIRNFDDAYYKSEGEFILSLKHADTSGAQAAVNRLRQFLGESTRTFSVDGEDLFLTMSYCVAEPSPGDIMGDFIQNMSKDLDSCTGERDVSIHFKEVSPLQRYVSAIDKEAVS